MSTFATTAFYRKAFSVQLHHWPYKQGKYIWGLWTLEAELYLEQLQQLDHNPHTIITAQIYILNKGELKDVVIDSVQHP